MGADGARGAAAVGPPSSSSSSVVMREWARAREGGAGVAATEVVADQVDFALRIHPINPFEVDLLWPVTKLPCGIGEVDRPIAAHDGIVRAVEFFTHVGARQRRTRLRHGIHPTGRMILHFGELACLKAAAACQQRVRRAASLQ